MQEPLTIIMTNEDLGPNTLSDLAKVTGGTVFALPLKTSLVQGEYAEEILEGYHKDIHRYLGLD